MPSMFSACLYCLTGLEDVTSEYKASMVAWLNNYVTLKAWIIPQSSASLQYRQYLNLQYTDE